MLLLVRVSKASLANCCLLRQYYGLPLYLVHGRGVHPPKPMMHIACSPIPTKTYKFPSLFPENLYVTPIFAKFKFFGLTYGVCFLPLLTVMHLCIMLYTTGYP